MIRGTAQYGRARYGRLEYGKGPDGISGGGGTSWTASFEADGRCSVTWTAVVHITTSGQWTAGGQCAVVWTPSVGFAAMWEADGECSVLWISGIGSPPITCQASGVVSGFPADPVPGILMDIPFSFG